VLTEIAKLWSGPEEELHRLADLGAGMAASQAGERRTSDGGGSPERRRSSDGGRDSKMSDGDGSVHAGSAMGSGELPAVDPELPLPPGASSRPKSLSPTKMMEMG